MATDSIATYSMRGGYGPSSLQSSDYRQVEQRGGGEAASEIAFEIASVFRGGSKKRKYRKRNKKLKTKKRYKKTKSKSKSRKSKKSKKRSKSRSKSKKK